MSLFIDNYRCIVYNNKHKDDVEVVRRMGRKSVAVLPQTQAILEQLGEQIKLARLRRHLSAELVAERMLKRETPLSRLGSMPQFCMH